MQNCKNRGFFAEIQYFNIFLEEFKVLHPDCTSDDE